MNLSQWLSDNCRWWVPNFWDLARSNVACAPGPLKSSSSSNHDGTSTSFGNKSGGYGRCPYYPKTWRFCTPLDLYFYCRMYPLRNSATSLSPCFVAGIRLPPFSCDYLLPFLVHYGIGLLQPPRGYVSRLHSPRIWPLKWKSAELDLAGLQVMGNVSLGRALCTAFFAVVWKAEM